jgi:hypothetical protein
LIESGPRAPFAKQFVKNFFACVDVSVARDTEEKSMRACKIFLCRGVERAKTRLQEVLISLGVL